MVGLEGKTLKELIFLGVPLFVETPKSMNTSIAWTDNSA